MSFLCPQVFMMNTIKDVQSVYTIPCRELLVE